MEKVKFKIYLIAIFLCILILQIFYFIQVTYVFSNTEYLSPAIITPIIVGSVLGTIMGQLYYQRIKIQNQANIIGNLKITEVINNILLLSNKTSEPISFLQSTIEVIIKANFIKLDPRLGFFLKDPDGKFRIKAQHNLSDELLKICAIKGITSGECLCGQVILTKKTQHANCVNHQHTITYKGMKDHAHYNVPIMYNEEILGIMVLYLAVGHKKNEREVEFLESVSSVIALVLHKYFVEEEKKAEIVKLNNELINQNEMLIKKNSELDKFVYSVYSGNSLPLNPGKSLPVFFRKVNAC
ncbi:GAF domain-containing protein [Chondrinema litorale]|uniref:GAF domain-containing protein n=1 Tax=Chondrinema litorale TaxID=2994555 RepID=UPI002543A610|nr:GAF domain-containing protein [Chondrinema litorale]UZR99032.1 GAF domain-containing protein [Chondrinema litorale]